MSYLSSTLSDVLITACYPRPAGPLWLTTQSRLMHSWCIGSGRGIVLPSPPFLCALSGCYEEEHSQWREQLMYQCRHERSLVGEIPEENEVRTVSHSRPSVPGSTHSLILVSLPISGSSSGYTDPTRTSTWLRDYLAFSPHIMLSRSSKSRRCRGRERECRRSHAAISPRYSSLLQIVGWRPLSSQLPNTHAF